MCTTKIWFDLIRHHLDNAVPALYKLEGGGHWPQRPYGSPTWWREHPMECSYKNRGNHPELAIPRMEVLIWRWQGVVALQALSSDMLPRTFPGPKAERDFLRSISLLQCCTCPFDGRQLRTMLSNGCYSENTPLISGWTRGLHTKEWTAFSYYIAF